MKYVDGFVLPVPKQRLHAYRRMAQKASKIWHEHGALEYRECVGDDLAVKMGMPFPKGIKTRPGETVVFAGMCDPKDMPFDCKRMLYGGFETIVEA
jgi:uncharacterized protein YbaA (DUF1428 family)